MSDMTRPKKTRKINHNVRNSTSIEDLDDYILTQILFRLPSCASVLACSLLNKRWYSLISDTRFAAQFSDHKTRNVALFKSRLNNEPVWTHLITTTNGIGPYRGPLLYCVGDKRTNKIVLRSPKFNLGYLHRQFFVEATFMDLLLCSDFTFHRGVGDPIYCVTNPITKQWVALPPCTDIQNPRLLKPWAALVCRRLHDYKQDYQFRVVLIDQTPLRVIKLSVYCSKIGMWKKFLLRVRTNPDKLLARTDNVYDKFQCVVCNGKIYLYHRSGFAAFNPFDVDNTTENADVIDAEVLPSLQVDGQLLESSGNLFVIHNNKGNVELLNEKRRDSVSYKENGSSIEIPLKVWKFNPNQLPLKWQKTFDGTCSGNVNRVKRSFDDYWTDDDDIDENYWQNLYIPIYNVKMHPKDDTLIYMHIHFEELFIFCDTRSRSITPLKHINGCSLLSFHRFELQWWPTSLPRR